MDIRNHWTWLLGRIYSGSLKCRWYQQERDPHVHIRVNFSKLCHKSDPHVLAKQVQQIFYVEDSIEKKAHFVIKKFPKDWCDAENMDAREEDANNPRAHDAHVVHEMNNNPDEMNWCRDDIPTTTVPNPEFTSQRN